MVVVDHGLRHAHLTVSIGCLWAHGNAAAWLQGCVRPAATATRPCISWHDSQLVAQWLIPIVGRSGLMEIDPKLALCWRVHEDISFSTLHGARLAGPVL